MNAAAIHQFCLPYRRPSSIAAANGNARNRHSSKNPAESDGATALTHGNNWQEH